MGLTMAQHRQAPSQFIKDEPGHDSVSLHPASFQVRNHQFHHTGCECNPQSPCGVKQHQNSQPVVPDCVWWLANNLVPHQLPTAACLRLREERGSKNQSELPSSAICNLRAIRQILQPRVLGITSQVLIPTFYIVLPPMSPRCEGSRQGSSDPESHFWKGGWFTFT